MMNYSLRRYLEKNHSSIQISDDFAEGLDLLNEDLRKNEIFLTGENHGVKANAKLRIEFLKYFKEKINFKYYLCELPYSMTYFLNKYIESGDEEILKDIYMALKGTDAWNQDDYNHWIELYRYNKQLSSKDKIRVMGIDIEHQPKNAFKCMEYIFSLRENIREIKGSVDIFTCEVDNLEDEEIKSISTKLKEELVNNEDRYRKILKEDYFKITYVNDNLLNMLEVYSGNNFNGIRDLKMYENFLKIYKHLPKGKYFGQIGLSHVFKKSFPYVNWFASLLNRDNSKFKDKVLSIAYAYRDCKYLYPTRRKNYVSSIDTLEHSIKEIKGLLNVDYILFKLNGLNSPFKQRLIWPLSHKYPSGGVTTDYIDYLLVIRRSKEMLAFKDNYWV